MKIVPTKNSNKNDVDFGAGTLCGVFRYLLKLYDKATEKHIIFWYLSEIKVPENNKKLMFRTTITNLIVYLKS